MIRNNNFISGVGLYLRYITVKNFPSKYEDDR